MNSYASNMCAICDIRPPLPDKLTCFICGGLVERIEAELETERVEQATQRSLEELAAQFPPGCIFYE